MEYHSSLNKGGDSDTGYHVDEPRGHYADERTHHRKPNTLCIHSFDTPRGVRFIETECSKTVVTMG